MSKLKILKKSYKINLGRIEEGFLYGDISCYAENRNKAKYKLLIQSKYESIRLYGESEDVTYLNIPVIRDKEGDLFFYDGQERTMSQIKECNFRKSRLVELDSILNDPSITHCHIYKGGYYLPGWCGYTEHVNLAGVYNKEEAISEAKSVHNMKIIPIDNNFLKNEL